MKQIIFVISTLLFLLLNGCAVQKRPPVNQPGDDANVKLAEAATSVSHSLIELARIQAAATPPVHGKQLPNPHSVGLLALGSVDWSGPIEPVVERMAKASGYKLRVLGNAPAIPVLITLSAHNSPLGDILRDIDFQAGKKADIKVYPATRVIELRYAKA